MSKTLMPHQAAKILAKGGEVTLDVLFGLYFFREAILTTGNKGRPFFRMDASGTNCYMDEPHPAFQDRNAEIIQFNDGVTLDMLNTKPGGGQVAYCAFYDGWSYRASLVLFREGTKGVEGYNYHGDKWIKAERFRVLGVVTAHEARKPGGEAMTTYNENGEGLNIFSHYAEIRAFRRYQSIRRLFDAAPSETTDFPVIREGLGRFYLPDEPRVIGTFAVQKPEGLGAHTDGKTPLLAQYTHLFFPETDPKKEATPDSVALIAYIDDYGAYRLGPAWLTRGDDGRLWAEVENSPEIKPSRFRVVRLCTGGGNPDGVRL